LYGLKTAAAWFHKHSSEWLVLLGFNLTKHDHDLWTNNKVDHDKYLATFVDDMLVWRKDPMVIIDEINNVFILERVGIHEYYNGGNVEMVNGHWVSDNVGLALSAKSYIANIIHKFEALSGHEFSKHNTPLLENSYPEREDSPLRSHNHSA
jgi:hypothetical protein